MQRIWTENIAGAADIDRILTGAPGFRMGPFALADMVGIDIQHSVMEVDVRAVLRRAGVCAHEPFGAARGGWSLGRKSGAGWFEYEDGKAVMPSVPPAPSTKPKSVWVRPSEHHPELQEPLLDLFREAGVFIETTAKPSDDALIVLTPVGWDLTTACMDLEIGPEAIGGHRRAVRHEGAAHADGDAGHGAGHP